MRLPLLGLLLLALATPARAAVILTVGPGRDFPTIRAANAAAGPGDRIEVYPTSGDGVYAQDRIHVEQPGLTFIGMGPTPIVIDGTGFEYSGIGSTPRAIFQTNPGADNVTIDNFELREAHNTSNNGAGVRINQARNTTVRRCDIHSNDMGMMSNGDGSATSGSGQLVEFCRIVDNGSFDDPGFNHNLYFGGASVTMQFCEVSGALTGNNVKSRAGFNLFQFNYIHDSANREFDLVDEEETALANANSVLIGNLIVKRDPLIGNSNVIHFGQDGGGQHNGTLYLIHNTIVTPHFGHIIHLDATQARAHLVNNIFYNNRQNGPLFYQLDGPPGPQVITGDHNWFSVGYDLSATGLNAATTYQGAALADHPGFVNPGARDFRLQFARIFDFAVNPAPSYLNFSGGSVTAIPQWQYAPVASALPRPTPGSLYLGFGVDNFPTPNHTTLRPDHRTEAGEDRRKP